MRLITVALKREVGHPSFSLRLFDSLMIGNVFTKFEKKSIEPADFFQGNDLKICFNRRGCSFFLILKSAFIYILIFVL